MTSPAWRPIQLEYYVDADGLLHMRGRPTLPSTAPLPVIASSIQVTKVGGLVPAVVTPPPPAPTGGPRTTAGSLPVGTASYTAPGGAIYIDPAGSDGTGTGLVGNPYATLAKAYSVVADGGTIVCRAGTYHDGQAPGGTGLGVQVSKNNITIQNYPAEAVWFDGSSVLTGWSSSTTLVAGRTVWQKSYVGTFDRGPTFSRGAADSTVPNWNFVSPVFPTAGWPEQVWIDGARLTQVNALSQVAAGKFFVIGSDVGSQRFTSSSIVIGNDPTGKTVQYADRTCAVSFTGPGSGGKLRGIGFRKYAPTMADFGCVKAWQPGVTIENVRVEDSSGIGISCLGSNITLKQITTQDTGSLGVHANNSDDFTIDGQWSEGANYRHFMFSPVSGGLKATRQRRTTIKNSVYNNNFGKGMWFDESVTEAVVFNCDFQGNEEIGFIAELNGRLSIYDCLITDNGFYGLNPFNCSTLRMWNCTIINNGGGVNSLTGGTFGSSRNLAILADDRAPQTSGSTGRDTRYAFPHPDLNNWEMSSCEVKNCIIGKSNSKTQQVLAGSIEDYRKSAGAAKSWTTYGLNWDGNLYYRVSTTNPSWLSILANSGSANVSVLFDLPALRSLTGQEANSQLVNGSDVLTTGYDLATGFTGYETTVPRPLPSDVATILGRTVGTAHLGAWR